MTNKLLTRHLKVTLRRPSWAPNLAKLGSMALESGLPNIATNNSLLLANGIPQVRVVCVCVPACAEFVWRVLGAIRAGFVGIDALANGADSTQKKA